MIRFFVPGLPRPGGSKRAFRHAQTGKIMVLDACKGSKDWKTAVAATAAERFREPLSGPLAVTMTFMLPRPKGHFRAGDSSDLRKSAPAYPDVRPDAGKLARSTEDSLTGIAWRDDAQIVDEILQKRYGPPIGVSITIVELVERVVRQLECTSTLPFDMPVSVQLADAKERDTHVA